MNVFQAGVCVRRRRRGAWLERRPRRKYRWGRERGRCGAESFSAGSRVTGQRLEHTATQISYHQVVQHLVHVRTDNTGWHNRAIEPLIEVVKFRRSHLLLRQDDRTCQILASRLSPLWWVFLYRGLSFTFGQCCHHWLSISFASRKYIELQSAQLTFSPSSSRQRDGRPQPKMLLARVLESQSRSASWVNPRGVKKNWGGRKAVAVLSRMTPI